MSIFYVTMCSSGHSGTTLTSSCERGRRRQLTLGLPSGWNPVASDARGRGLTWDLAGGGAGEEARRSPAAGGPRYRARPMTNTAWSSPPSPSPGPPRACPADGVATERRKGKGRVPASYPDTRHSRCSPDALSRDLLSVSVRRVHHCPLPAPRPEVTGELVPGGPVGLGGPCHLASPALHGGHGVSCSSSFCHKGFSRISGE